MNILILTKIYPADDLYQAETPVVHYFAKEWIKNHEVKVIVNYPAFPSIYNFFINQFEKYITSIFGALPPKPCCVRHYTLDNVDIYRFPIKKYIPHGIYNRKTIEKQHYLIKQIIEKTGFIPDIIVGHWWNPQLPLIKKLKDEYHCKTALVLHSDVALIRNYKSDFDGIDYWGFRSKALYENFTKIWGNKFKTFLCYSGIPKEMLNTDTNKRKISSKLTSFLFVGQLIRRKFPAEIIPAIAKTYSQEEEYSITYIGSGKEEQRINKYAKKYGIQDHIHLMGRTDRMQVKKYMLQNDCFIMISKNEAFGLVYLEAMSAGCIVIAAKKEGFDGIIRHGENGFLCDAGNAEELAKVIIEINSLSLDDKEKISKNAIMTARNYTDEHVADMYLNSILS